MESGFLDKEKPVEPISAAELEKKFAATQAEAQRLRAVLDPEETPYDSRYEERAVLAELAKQAAANEAAETGSENARRARTMRALAEAQLGRNFIDTEESGSAQPKLEAAIEGLEGVEAEAVAHIEALNNLGVVWCNRGEPEKALGLLERAAAAHKAVTTKQQTLLKVAGGLPGGAPGLLDEGARVRLQDARTLSTFYLAQVYGALGRRAEAASHCHETMRRQLLRREVSDRADAAARESALKAGGAGGELAFGSETRSEFTFDSSEWARNASDLSKYYATVSRLDLAEHCLYAAESVLSQERRVQAAKDARRVAERKAAEAAAAAPAEEAAVDATDADGTTSGGGSGGEGGGGEGGGGEGGIDSLVATIAQAEQRVVDLEAEGSFAGGGEEAKPVNRIFLNGTAEDKAESERVAKAAQASVAKVCDLSTSPSFDGLRSPSLSPRASHLSHLSPLSPRRPRRG